MTTPVALQVGETMAEAIERTAPERRQAERSEMMKINGIAAPERGVQGFGPQAVLGAGPRGGTNVSGHAVVPATPAPAAPAPVPFSAPESDGPRMEHGQRIHDPARQELANRITAAYMAKLPAQRPALRAQYEAELAQAFNGTHKYSARGVTTVTPAVIPDHLDPAKVAAARAVIAANDTGIPSDWEAIPATRMIHGYSMAAAGDNTHMAPGTAELFATARSLNMTQEQVDAFIRADLAKP